MQRSLTRGLINRINANPLSNLVEFSLYVPLLISGIGTKQDIRQGLHWMYQQAKLRAYPTFRGLVYRFHLAFGHKVPEDCPLVDWLYEAACAGSWAALDDLAVVGVSKRSDALLVLRTQNCGVGADFFFRHNMLHSFSPIEIQDVDNLRENLGKIPMTDTPAILPVNQRGDLLIHYVAACSNEVVLQWVLGEDPQCLNLQNSLGETPLFHATRSGRAANVVTLLRDGADASINAHDGVSPLHFLVNIDSNALEPVLKGMLASAKLDLNKLCQSPILYAASQRIHSAYGEIFCRGTPLNWAVCRNRSDLVKLLLLNGAHALASDQNIAPLNLAAHLHNHECFTVLLEHEINKGPYIQFSFASLLEAVVVNADLYSRIVRHGIQHEEMLEKTLTILADRTADVAILSGIGGSRTMLLFAIKCGFEEIATKVLDYPRWRQELDLADVTTRMTPLLAAVAADMEKLVPLVLQAGANLNSVGRRTSLLGEDPWNALHYFIAAENDCESSLIPILLPLAQADSTNEQTETPLALALDYNSFEMARMLVEKADAGFEALCTTGCDGALTFAYPTTVLGRIIKSNMHNSKARLEFLLYPPAGCAEPEFIVTPGVGHSALHEVASMHVGTKDQTGVHLGPNQVDNLANREILMTLLEKYRDPQHLDYQAPDKLCTALHCAVSACNSMAVEELLSAGADWRLVDAEGDTILSALERWSRSTTVNKFGREKVQEMQQIVESHIDTFG